MAWIRVDQAGPPISRPVLVRTAEDDEPIIAFLSSEDIWYAGGALIQSSMTLLGATPVAWCEPDDRDSL